MRQWWRVDDDAEGEVRSTSLESRSTEPLTESTVPALVGSFIEHVHPVVNGRAARSYYAPAPHQEDTMIMDHKLKLDDGRA